MYGAGRSPWGYALPWGDVTTKDNKLFLAVFNWPKDGKLYLPGLSAKIKKINLLDGKKKCKLKYKMENGWHVIDVPFETPKDLIIKDLKI